MLAYVVRRVYIGMGTIFAISIIIFAVIEAPLATSSHTRSGSFRLFK